MDSPSTLSSPPNAAPPGIALKVQIVVIGAGQAGLSAAYHLKRLGLTPHKGFVVLTSLQDRGAPSRTAGPR
jgi:glycine/D-amino acid oxidase-like deaminating enzyme